MVITDNILTESGHGSCEATPIDALEMTLGMPPLDMLVMCEAETTGYGVEEKEPRAEHPQLEILKSRPLSTVKDRITTNTRKRGLKSTFLKGKTVNL